MYFTNGSSRAFEMLMRGKPGFDRYENARLLPFVSATKTAAVPTVRIAIPVTFTVRIGSTSSVCTRNVRMSRAS